MLELTITSPYLIDDSEDKLSTPTLTNAEEGFPNYSKMSQPIGKGSTGTWKWDEADLMSWNRHFMEHGQTHA